MPGSHDLEGLVKFLKREDWTDCFDEVFEDHLGSLWESDDADLEVLFDVLGEDRAMTLWGAVFEDFLTQDFDVPGVNLIDDYLKRRGWKERAGTKAYMKALRNSVMSLYEVSDVAPGQSLTARDLIRGGEPITVSEASATRDLKQQDRIAARIVPVLGKYILTGGVLPFSPKAGDVLFDGLRALLKASGENVDELAEMNEEMLQAAAPIFTQSWLIDVLEPITGVALAEGPMEAPNVPPDIEKRIVHGTMERHYRALLDQPLPLFGDKTARQAVENVAGRRKVAEWLKSIESMSAAQPDPSDPMTTYDFTWMWLELGVLDLRK